MSVKIRLARHGRRNLPFYRMVVCDCDARRDGRFLEIVGRVNTLVEPRLATIKEERIKHWLDIGAQPSDTAAQVIDKFLPGYIASLESNRKEKIRSGRAKRKARQKSAAATA